MILSDNFAFQQASAIQHTRWILQGGWKKKTAWLTLILGGVVLIYKHVLDNFAQDSFYAELEMAENESRTHAGKVPLGYNITDPDDDEDDYD